MGEDSLDGLVVHFCALNVRTDRVGQVPDLGERSRHTDIDTFTMVIVRRVSGSYRRW